MPDINSFVGNTAKGAAMGSTFGLPGTIIGGAVGAISSLFGSSPEEERQARKRELLNQIAAYRMQAVARAKELKSGGIRDISAETSTQLARAQSDVGRRAAASGRVGDTESMMLPVTSNINEQGGNRLEGAIRSYDTGIANINTQFDNQALSAESDYAARPIEPTLADQLMNVGSSYLQYKQNQDYVDAYKNQYATNTGGTSNTASPSLIEKAPSVSSFMGSSPSSLSSLSDTMRSNYSLEPMSNTLYRPEDNSNPYAWGMNKRFSKVPSPYDYGWK